MLLIILFVLCLSPSSSPAIVPPASEITQSRSDSPFEISLWDYTKYPEVAKNEKVIKALHWQDKLGDNMLIFSRSNITKATSQQCVQPPNCYRSEIFVRHFVTRNNQLRLLRKVYDFVKNCPQSLHIGFTRDSTTITDLDNDGIAEITFIYSYACKSLKTPPVMKLIMLENSKKFALRGHISLTDKAYPTQSRGYTIDDAYKFAPEVFLLHSKIQWQRFDKHINPDISSLD